MKTTKPTSPKSPQNPQKYSCKTPLGEIMVEIDPALIEEYEARVGPFTENKPSYFLFTSSNENIDYTNISVVREEIEEGIREEIEVYNDKDEIIKKIIEFEEHNHA